MNQELSAVDWDREFNGRDVNEKWNILKGKILESVEKNIPKHVTNEDRKKTKPLWMNREALAAVKKKHRSWTKYMKTKQHIHLQYYYRDRNAATLACRNARSNFERKISEEDNPKSFYKYANSKRVNKSGISHLKRSDESYTENDYEKAEELNKFFHSVFVEEDLSNVPVMEDRSNGNSLSDLEISEKEVLNLLEKLNVNKSTGPDLLHPRVLKELKNSIVKPLTTIFTESINHGVLPDDWKIGDVKALFKKGSRENAGNYRPVSLTSIPCKLLEKLVRDKVVNYMNENDLFTDSQYGFRSSRSCQLQLLDTMERWTDWIDQGKSFDCLYYDYRKAFDRVAHCRLIVKLQAYGIGGKILTWIRAFLTDRKQCVVVNSCKSSTSPVSSGIPQGSVLGPTLFLIFINDIEDGIKSTMRLFADDSKLFNLASSEDETSIIQEDTDKLSLWSEKWLLSYNVDKCGTIHYGNNNLEQKYYLSDNNVKKELPTAESERDIGVLFDSQLKFRDHMSNSINKANKVTGLIRRTFLHINVKQFRKLYKTLVRPHLEFCNTVWAPRFIKDINAIERAQKRATKLVSCIRNLPYEERLKRLKLPTLSYRRFRGDIIQVWKLIHGKEDLDYKHFFEKSNYTDHFIRGHSQHLKTKTSKRDIRRHFFSVRVIAPWNKLTEDIVNAPSLNTLKNRLDNLMKDHQYTTIPENKTWASILEGVIKDQ